MSGCKAIYHINDHINRKTTTGLTPGIFRLSDAALSAALNVASFATFRMDSRTHSIFSPRMITTTEKYFPADRSNCPVQPTLPNLLSSTQSSPQPDVPSIVTNDLY
jgi:hypothetical protein